MEDFINQMHQDIKNDNPDFMKLFNKNGRKICIKIAKKSKEIIKYNEMLFQKYNENCVEEWYNLMIENKKILIGDPIRRLKNYKNLLIYLYYIYFKKQNDEKLNKLYI